MKKLLGLIALLFFTAGAVKAQEYDLEFKDSLATGGATLKVGSTYNLYVWVKNNGPQMFNGPLALHAFVGLTESDFNTSSPQTSIALDSNGAITYNIRPGESILVKKTIYISDKLFGADSTHIIIIWPSGKAKPGSALFTDVNNTNNIAKPYIKIKVTNGKPKRNSFTTSIGTVYSDDNLISIYPNPVSDYIYIACNNKLKATVQIMDMNGKLIFTTTLSGTEKIQSIDITNSDVFKSGLYILNLISNRGTKSSHRLYISK